MNRDQFNLAVRKHFRSRERRLFMANLASQASLITLEEDKKRLESIFDLADNLEIEFQYEDAYIEELLQAKDYLRWTARRIIPKYAMYDAWCTNLFAQQIFADMTPALLIIPIEHSDNVLNLAASIYQDCDIDAYPILADAMEEAGCCSPTVLDHLRQPNNHVRGCWVIDLLLSKRSYIKEYD